MECDGCLLEYYRLPLLLLLCLLQPLRLFAAVRPCFTAVAVICSSSALLYSRCGYLQQLGQALQLLRLSAAVRPALQLLQIYAALMHCSTAVKVICSCYTLLYDCYGYLQLLYIRQMIILSIHVV